MSVDLAILAATAVFAVLSVVPYTGARFFGWSPRWVAGNRATPPEDAPWVGRAERAHRNLLESLPAFAVLVLVAHVAGKANEMTALGSLLFLGGRIAYAPVYVLGIVWVRTFFWLVSIAGLGLIAVQLF